ncbi:TPA: hypothetical protein ROY17_005848 [Bacillus thuringiensis]|nr:hypothetical protein [Bacillus thuringiensis]
MNLEDIKAEYINSTYTNQICSNCSKKNREQDRA